MGSPFIPDSTPPSTSTLPLGSSVAVSPGGAPIGMGAVLVQPAAALAAGTPASAATTTLAATTLPRLRTPTSSLSLSRRLPAPRRYRRWRRSAIAEPTHPHSAAVGRRRSRQRLAHCAAS